MGNSFSDVDFSAYDKVIFLSSEKIKCYDDVKFSKNLEFPNSSDVDLSFCDLQNVHSILFGWYDLKECTNLSFKDGADIGFAFARGLPHNLDVSKCREVSFFKCDMKDISSVSFKDGAKVNLQEARNLPPHTDFSTCSILMLTNCNLKDQTELRFRDGAEVYLQEACNLPKQLDFSMCKDGEVWLTNSVYRKLGLRVR